MKTVLLAYEREQDLAAVESVLQSRGHRVVKARTGVEALDAIRADTPDAVVSDVLLPRLDGFALCRRLREEPEFLHLPFVLHSFRVEGPKYEAFAAEVGAQRFLPRGSTLEQLVDALEESSPGSGTMRMPALVPELLDRREQDRRRLTELERQVRELESTKQQLEAAERVARERAEREARARTDFAASESLRIRELQNRIRDLEAAHRQARDVAESARQQASDAAAAVSRGAEADARAVQARLESLEARLTEAQTARARLQSSAADAERAFGAQPTPTFVVDVESRLVHAASDGAAALVGQEPAALRGRPLQEVLRGVSFAEDPARETRFSWRRQDGSDARLELRRVPTTFAGRACWLVTARDVTREAELAEREVALTRTASALQSAPEACAIVDPDGRFLFANGALHVLLGTTPAELDTLGLPTRGTDTDTATTVRTTGVTATGLHRHESTWRRPDGRSFDAEWSLAPLEGDTTLRVLVVRDVTAERHEAARDARERLRVARLLDLAQAESSTEHELLDQAVRVALELTGSAQACAFVTGHEASTIELVARREAVAGEVPSPPVRWQGAAERSSALHECLETQRPVVRESAEPAGALRAAGLPPTLGRQIAMPLLDGSRIAGVLLLVDAPRAYDDDDRRDLAQIAATAARLRRRLRTANEEAGAAEQAQRTLQGSIAALAALAETQDAGRAGRSMRVGDLAAAIGAALGLSPHAVQGLRVAGQLIDVGMLQVPRELLWRPDTLTSAEFELVKTHAERGYELLRRIEFPWPVAEIVRQHHERLDGSGYPRCLRGEEILLEARIVAVADAVEAMLAQRPHRPALGVAACIEELQSQAGRRYDARVVKACVRMLRDAQVPAAPAPGPQHQHEGEAPAGQRIA